MKKILFGCMIALSLASCSDDEVVTRQVDGSKINFTVTAANGNSRATDVYCNNNLPTGFTVYATTEGKTLIDGDQIAYTGGKWVDQAGDRYWPETAVDFYAHVNADANGTSTWSWDGTTAPKFSNFTVNSDPASQVDLMYAVKTAQTKTKGATQPDVALNFRHALSQVVFYAKNTNPSLYVEVTGIGIANLTGSNTYTLPTEDSDDNIEHGTTATTDPAATTSRGTWENQGTVTAGTTAYEVDFDAVELTGSKTATESNLTDNTNTTHTAADSSFGTAMLLIPQKTEALVPSSTASDETGTYFMVYCKIWNVSGTTVDKDSDVVLFDSSADMADGSGKVGAIRIPADFDWKEGIKYKYTFVFGDGNGGWDPHDPQPILVPITFNVSVDEFVSVDNSDVTMQTTTGSN